MIKWDSFNNPNTGQNYPAEFVKFVVYKKSISEYLTYYLDGVPELTLDSKAVLITAKPEDISLYFKKWLNKISVTR